MEAPLVKLCTSYIIPTPSKQASLCERLGLRMRETGNEKREDNVVSSGH
jgi:hypothetical protein